MNNQRALFHVQNELQRLATLRAQQTVRSGALTRPAPRSFASETPAVDKPALVVFLENGGLDVDIGAIAERALALLPLGDIAQRIVGKALRESINEAFRKATDGLLESAELLLNDYAGAAPEHYREVVVLRDGRATYAELRDTLLRLTNQGTATDVFVLAHGGRDVLVGEHGQRIDATMIGQGLRDANAGHSLRLRSVYMMNCIGQSLNAAWLKAGALTSSGTVGNNYLPEPTTYYFFRRWKAGDSFADAVTSAYRKSIDTLRAAIEDILPDFLDGPVSELLDIETWDFVRESAPQIAGSGDIKIGTTKLTWSQGLRTEYMIVPTTRGRSQRPWAGSSSRTRAITSHGNGGLLGRGFGEPIEAEPTLDAGESPFKASDVPDTGALERFNAAVLNILEHRRGGSFSSKWEGHGVTRDITYDGSTLLKVSESTQGTYCVAATFQAFCEAYLSASQRLAAEPWIGDQPYRPWFLALQRIFFVRGLEGDIFADIPEDIRSRAKEEGSALAIQWAGLGDAVELENLQRGDFVQFWRTDGSGHSAIVWQLDRDADGKPSNLWYWSSQSKGLTEGGAAAPAGYGLNREPLSRIPRLFAARVTTML